MKLSTSVLTALSIFGLIILYFGARALVGGAGATADVDEAPERILVVAEEIAAQPWRDVITVRGMTKAERKVAVRTETAGTVDETPTALGAHVKKGDVLCRLRVDARRAAVAEARAAVRKAQLDYDAGVKLSDEGFRSETSVAALKAALDLASANLERATLDLGNTEIKAPFDGVFDQRNAEVGDFLKIGEPCGVVIQRSPFLIAGAVPERDVAKIAVGDRGVAQLATGETVEGAVRFVASSANPATRTFTVELETPNEDGSLRDGVTAEFKVFATERSAHLLPRSALTLDDEGRIGVRSVDGDNVVVFTPVSLIGEAPDGVWVGGLDGAPRIITRGQDYVRAGETVAVSTESAS